MIVPCVHYVCKGSLMLHIVFICVHNHHVNAASIWKKNPPIGIVGWGGEAIIYIRRDKRGNPVQNAPLLPSPNAPFTTNIIKISNYCLGIIILRREIIIMWVLIKIQRWIFVHFLWCDLPPYFSTRVCEQHLYDRVKGQHPLPDRGVAMRSRDSASQGQKWLWYCRRCQELFLLLGNIL